MERGRERVDTSPNRYHHSFNHISSGICRRLNELIAVVNNATT